jgi:hypothetical protein
MNVMTGVDRAGRNMMLTMSLRTAVASLRGNKTRSILTTLGITVGVAAVICVMAVGSGARQQVTDRIKRLGTNLLLIQPEQVTTARTKSLSIQRNFAPEEPRYRETIADEIFRSDGLALENALEGDGSGTDSVGNLRVTPTTRRTLTEDDAAAVLSEIQGVKIAAHIIWGKKQVVAGPYNWWTTIFGNDSDFLGARDWTIATGRTFTENEYNPAPRSPSSVRSLRID